MLSKLLHLPADYPEICLTVFLAILAGLFLLSLVIGYFDTRSVARTLKRMNAAIGASTTPSDFYTGFYDVKDRITKVIAKREEIRAAWSFYEHGLRPIAPAGAAASLAATVEFNAVLPQTKSLVERNSFSRIALMMPNLLIGLGLFFTFWGLAAVISQAANTLPGTKTLSAAVKLSTDALAGDTQKAGSDKIPDIMDPLRKLLEAAATKFVTSLAAVIFSLVLTVFLRVRMGKVDRIRASLCRVLRQVAPPVSVAAVLQLALAEQFKQTGSMERMATDLAVKIGEKFQSVSNELSGELRNQSAAIIGLADNLKNININAVSEMVKTATDAIDKQVSGHTKAIAEHLRAVADELSNVPSKVRETFDAVLIDIKFTGDQMLAVKGELDACVARVSTALIDASERFDKAKQLPDSLTTAVANMEKAASSLAPLAKELATLEAGLQSTVPQIAASSEVVAKSLSDTQKNWEDQSSHVRKLDEQLAVTVKTLASMFDSYRDGLRSFTEQLQQEWMAMVGGISNQTRELTEGQTLTADILQRLERLQERFTDAADALASHLASKPPAPDSSSNDPPPVA